MRLVLLDGARMRDKASFHEALKAAFGFPDYYGRNLDALHDCLSEQRDVQVCFSDHRAMLEKLGEYGQTALEILMEASKAQARFFVLLR